MYFREALKREKIYDGLCQSATITGTSHLTSGSNSTGTMNRNSEVALSIQYFVLCNTNVVVLSPFARTDRNNFLVNRSPKIYLVLISANNDVHPRSRNNSVVNSLTHSLTHSLMALNMY